MNLTRIMYIQGFSKNMQSVSMINDELLHYFFSFAGVLEKDKKHGLYIKSKLCQYKNTKAKKPFGENAVLNM